MPTTLTPLFAERALVLATPDERVLVAGDLHLGLEDELRQRGVHGLVESERLVAHLEALATAQGADRIVVLGDVKHSLGAREAEARALLPLEGLKVPVEIVPGNHDGALSELTRLRLHDARGIVLGDVGLLHGHTWPAPAVVAGGRLVLCHNHPHIALRDELGTIHSEPCWVRAPLSSMVRERYPEARLPGEAVLVPAFNPLLGGIAMNRPNERPLGPLLANGVIDLARGHAYTLDGVDLGTLAKLGEAFRGV